MVSPVTDPAMVNCDFAKLPIAVPSTDAFHVSMKSAPIPYRNENMSAETRTFKLLMNMSIDSFPVGMLACPVIFEFISPIVLVCSENNEVLTVFGSMKYQNANAHTIPRNSIMNNIIISLWRFHSVSSFSFESILFSSCMVNV